MTKKKVNYFDLKVRFNDVVMRELGLDTTEEDYLYNADTDSILQIKGKYIKYIDDEYFVLHHNEIELNLIENPRLMELISLPFLQALCDRCNVIFQSINQCQLTGSDKGIFVLSYIKEGKILDLKSDAFVNESVRIFNLICKINRTLNLYKFDEFDIKIERKKK